MLMQTVLKLSTKNLECNVELYIFYISNFFTHIMLNVDFLTHPCPALVLLSVLIMHACVPAVQTQSHIQTLQQVMSCQCTDIK